MAKIIIIGSGIAGLFAGLQLSKAGHEITIVTKQRPIDSSTNWAQGGIAAILEKTNEKGIQAHIQDTLNCGDGLCDQNVVETVVREAGDRIRDLLEIGVGFEKENNAFHMAQEGGHSEARILHSKDATGKEIERALTSAVSKSNIKMLPMTLAVDLIQSVHGDISQGIAGVWSLDLISNEMKADSADAVIIATGGAGCLWEQTTNPNVSTGDGLAMAIRAGAKAKDMAFVQFHPTSLAIPDTTRPFLITEALRGAGGVLLDDEGLDIFLTTGKNPKEISFTLKHSPLGSLATRDIVARACDKVMKKTGAKNVWLVTSHLNREKLREDFPNIETQLNKNGFSLGREPLPVAPAAHYMVGGLEVDLEGRVFCTKNQPISGLFAIGEVACTGMHGANRLASNSLLEGVVFANRTAKHIISNINIQNRMVPKWRADGLKDLVEHAPLKHDLSALKSSMTTDVGIVRRFSRLMRASRRLNLLEKEIDLIWKNSLPTRDIIELRNLILVAKLIVEDANSRTENKGLHFNLDLHENVHYNQPIE